MKSRPTSSQFLVVGSLALCLSVAVAYETSRHGLVISAAIALLAILWAVPRAYVPAIALALFVLVPIDYLNVPSVLTYVTPAVVATGVFFLRGLLEPPGQRVKGGGVLAVSLILLLAWMILTTAFSLDIHTTIRWLVPFAVSGVGLAFLVRSEGRSAPLLRGAWTYLGVALAVYAAVEALLLKNNPLFGSIYANAPSGGFTQYTDWATYRATTTLGHPLLNSAFFACAMGFALDSWLKRPTLARAFAVAATASAVLLTASRTGVIAMGAAAAAVLLVRSFSYTGRRAPSLRIVLALVMLALIGVALGSQVLARQNSQEGVLSADARSTFVSQGLALASQRPVVGFGEGTLQLAGSTYGSNPSGDYENSYVETAIAIGYPGLALLVGVYAAMLLLAFRHRDAGLFGAGLAYMVSQGSFNLLAAYPAAAVLLGALLALSFVAPREDSRGYP